jgi:hypothetical protein
MTCSTQKQLGEGAFSGQRSAVSGQLSANRFRGPLASGTPEANTGAASEPGELIAES